ncbi:hypothetical protein UPF0118 [Rhodovulum sp. PH10]|uniref:AI-2E family transporter n=1 Tax=Rhodovulum sp. PH10 TaxID=1187851 RepID=UPI00027C1FCB|nr:AI-2E family transporter [Rhodovulum sp. PH10]EJW12943.1 hypothetical protein UPF0118 [Rhodovulum sp. PH10]
MNVIDRIQRVPLLGLAAATVGLVVLVVLFWLLGHVLLLVFGAVLLAVMLRKVAVAISRRVGVGPDWTLALILLVAVLAVAGWSWFLMPQVVGQMSEAAAKIPDYTDRLHALFSQSPIGRYFWDNGVEALQSGSLSGALSSVGTTALGAATDIVIVLFVGIYLAIEPSLYVGGIVSLFPQEGRAEARRVLMDIGNTLFWWLIGRLISMAIIGVLITIGLYVLGVPFALTLGLWSALITFLPNIGPFLSTAPNAVVALEAGGLQLALWTIGLHVVVQTIESYLITPMVQQRAIAMPPALTLSVQVAMGTLFGLTGLALATPFAAMWIVLIRRVYIGHVLGDRAALHGAASGER